MEFLLLAAAALALFSSPSTPPPTAAARKKGAPPPPPPSTRTTSTAAATAASSAAAVRAAHEDDTDVDAPAGGQSWVDEDGKIHLPYWTPAQLAAKAKQDAAANADQEKTGTAIVSQTCDALIPGSGAVVSKVANALNIFDSEPITAAERARNEQILAQQAEEVVYNPETGVAGQSHVVPVYVQVDPSALQMKDDSNDQKKRGDL